MALDWTSAEPGRALKELRARRTIPGEWMPAQPGDPLKEIDTPALVVDLDKCEANMARLAAALAGTGVELRPHASTHKCAEIARRQVEAGAVGVCCLKLGEAEALLAGSVKDVLITNQIVGEAKMRRAARVARAYAPARLGLCIDHIGVARQLAAICTAEQAVLDVYIEVDAGQNRSGTTDAASAVELADYLHGHPALRFRGLHAYAGLAQHRRGVPAPPRRRPGRRAAGGRRARRHRGRRAALRNGGGRGHGHLAR